MTDAPTTHHRCPPRMRPGADATTARALWAACSVAFASLLLAACGADIAVPAGGAECANLTDCGGICADTKLDPAHCGRCGTACAEAEVCDRGTCAPGCSPGLTACARSCVDNKTDPSHCGACESACGTGEVCSVGACALECGGGTTECGGLCIDTDVDPSHCGACGNACAAGLVCSVGSCALECGGGTTECGGLCVDTDFDPASCGACGNACGSGLVCDSGSCALECSGGTSKCGLLCVNTSNDPAHCGGCNYPCPTSQVCSNWLCGLQCSGSTTNCFGFCVDTSHDPDHCGSCSNACPSTAICSNGSCTVECWGGTIKCGSSCVNTSSDPDHCGACNAPCGPNEACLNGSCAPVLSYMAVAQMCRGWARSDGLFYCNLGGNTFTGRDEIALLYNSFFIFDLSAVTGTVLTATLRLEVATYYGPDPSEAFSVWDVSTPWTTLQSGQDVAVYNDLMTGVAYGGFVVGSQDADQIKEAVLNASAIADIQSALSGHYAVGVHCDNIGSIFPEGARFSTGGDNRVHELVIATIP